MIDLSSTSEECLPENDFGSTSDFAWGELKELVCSPSYESAMIPGTWAKDERGSFGEIEIIQQQLLASIARMNSFIAIYAHSTSIDFQELKTLGEGRNLGSPTIYEESIGDQTLLASFRPDFWNIKRYTAHVTGVTFKKSNVSSFSGRSLFVPVSVSAEVISEANQRDLTDDLETTVSLLNATFPMLHEIDVTIHHDPEIFDRFTICFTLTVSGDADAILDCEYLFKKRLFSKIDIDVRPLLAFTYKFLK